MTEITVVIPNYNGIQYMEACLKALYAQKSAPSFEVIVVDNGSTDGSAELTEQHFPQVRLLKLPQNTGFCHAVNVGINACDSPYIVLLNNDTRVYPEFLKALYNAIINTPGAFSVSAKMLMWDDPGLLDGAGDLYCILGYASAIGKGKAAEKYNSSYEIFSACGGAAIYNRELLIRLGLFDELHFAYLEDLDIGYRAQINGYRNYYEPAAQVVHFGSASTGSRYNLRKTRLAAANNIYVVIKNMPLLQLLINLPFLFVGYVVKFLFFLKKGMAGEYLRGLGDGFKKSFSKEGRGKKVRFHFANLGHYIRIEWKLLCNVFKLLLHYF